MPVRLNIVSRANRLLKNVVEAADTRQKQAKKRSLCVINEHFEPVFNTVAATQIVLLTRSSGLIIFPQCVSQDIG